MLMPDPLLGKLERHQLILLKMNLLVEGHRAKKKNRAGGLRYLYWLLILLSLILLPSIRVSAQNEFKVFFSPEESNVPIGGSETIKIAVANGMNINAYDLTVLYDSDKVSLASWSHGNYLSNLAVVYYENEPGKLHIAATQLATPGVSGDGILINLMFSSINEGVSVLSLADVEFYDPNGNSNTPQVTEGFLNVVQAAPTFTPTYTVTQKLSPTPRRTYTTTKTATQMSFRTSTSSPSQVAYPFTATPSTYLIITSPTSSPEGNPASTLQSISETPTPYINNTTLARNSEPVEAGGLAKNGGESLEKDGNLKLVNTTLWVFVFLLISAMIAFIYLIFIRKKNER